MPKEAVLRKRSRLLAIVAVVCLAAGVSAQESTVTKDQIDHWMTEPSNWGRWGKDDQRGTLNLITADKRKDDSFEGKIYNGFERARITQGAGCVDNGIENQKAGDMTRGILIDMPLLKNVPYLKPGTPITPADLEAWEKYAGIKIGSGDAVFLRTGRWVMRKQEGAWNVAANAAGFHASVMPWMKRRDVALLGNDGVTDVQPSGVQGSPRPIHQVAIVALGLPLIDVMDLEAVSQEAARRHTWEFLLTFAPVPVLGGTGFPINPIATF
jgi:hypothetical protein